MTKAEIIDEIRRLASANDGVPPGQKRFASATGIPPAASLDKFWARWSDALIEAGFEPNSWTPAYDKDWLIEKLVGEIGRYPTRREIALRSRKDSDFPSYQPFQNRGSKAEFAKQVIQWCELKTGYEDVIAICTPIAATTQAKKATSADHNDTTGYVYLLKSGRFYKIGHTNSIARREYELSIQLPEKATLVHKIETDDPAGIEAYWHKRFANKRANGEWFSLTTEDIRIFKRRRKFM